MLGADLESDGIRVATLTIAGQIVEGTAFDPSASPSATGRSSIRMVPGKRSSALPASRRVQTRRTIAEQIFTRVLVSPLQATPTTSKGVTSDPDEAARAPFGHILIGDPAEAVKRLADTILGTGRPPLPAREPLPQADTDGPAFTEEAILDAVNAAKTDDTVIAHEWTSADLKWDRFDFTRPGSLYFGASGGLGWGLPGAIGLQLGDPSRRVVALLGDGAVHYSVSGLWTAAQHNIPVVFVVARNSEYEAPKRFTRLMHAPDTPGLELPGMDIPGIATSYGVPSERVKSLSELTSAVKDGLSSDRPTLIEISERRLAGS